MCLYQSNSPACDKGYQTDLYVAISIKLIRLCYLTDPCVIISIKLTLMWQSNWPVCGNSTCGYIIQTDLYVWISINPSRMWQYRMSNNVSACGSHTLRMPRYILIYLMIDRNGARIELGILAINSKQSTTIKYINTYCRIMLSFQVWPDLSKGFLYTYHFYSMM